jgi:hypothetical protein
MLGKFINHCEDSLTAAVFTHPEHLHAALFDARQKLGTALISVAVTGHIDVRNNVAAASHNAVSSRDE